MTKRVTLEICGDCYEKFLTIATLVAHKEICPKAKRGNNAERDTAAR